MGVSHFRRQICDKTRQLFKLFVLHQTPDSSSIKFFEFFLIFQKKNKQKQIFMNFSKKKKQIFYVIVAGGGFIMYVKYGLMPFIPNDYLGEYHWVTGTIFAFFCYFSFYMACKTSPGSVENRNLDQYLKKYKFDGIMFMDNNKCTTCKIKKQPIFRFLILE